MSGKNYKTKIKQASILSLASICLPALAMAQDVAASESATLSISKFQMMRYVLSGFALLFFLIILVLGNVVKNAVKFYAERERKKNDGNGIKPIVPLLLIFLLMSVGVRAEEVAEAVPVEHPMGLPLDIYVLIFIVAVEFAAIMVFSFITLKFLNVSDSVVAKAAPKKILFKDLFQKMNQTVAIEDEDMLDLHHDYDGIRELDNKVPKWWQYAFYLSILFGVIYIYRMFVAETLPDQYAELRTANAVAAVQQAEYLKNSANNVDENTVVMLDAAGIAEGGILYSKNCVACHGDKGQGGVGPNLTDDYWLHKGSLKDVFHSIKYGWTEKGMKSWKDDFSPAQIAELASYVKSLRGSNPPAAKEPQGALFTEAANDNATDTAKTK